MHTNTRKAKQVKRQPLIISSVSYEMDRSESHFHDKQDRRVEFHSKMRQSSRLLNRVLAAFTS